MHVLKNINESNFILLLADEEEYLLNISRAINSFEKNHKVLYVCLSKKYTEVISDLKNHGVDVSKFYFLDTMTSPAKKRPPAKNCLFLPGQKDLKKIQATVSVVSRKEKCDIIIFDTISNLLVYEERHSIVRSTHDWITEKKRINKTIVYFVMKSADRGPDNIEEESQMAKDLEMFADTTVEFSKNDKDK